MAEGAPISADEAFQILRKIIVRDFEVEEDQVQLGSGLEDLDRTARLLAAFIRDLPPDLDLTPGV